VDEKFFLYLSVLNAKKIGFFLSSSIRPCLVLIRYFAFPSFSSFIVEVADDRWPLNDKLQM